MKFDKKLILEANEIIIQNKKTTLENSSENIKRDINLLPKVLKYFNKIDIQRLKIDDNELTILLNEDYLYLDNKFLNISANLDFSDTLVNLDFHSAYLKDLDLILTGKSKINLEKEILNFFGNYIIKDAKGELNIQITPKIFDFYVNTSNEVKDIKLLKNFFRLGKVSESWMYDNVTGDIKLDYLTGQFDLEKQKPIIDSIKGEVTIKDAKIRFHKNTKTVDTNKLQIKYKNDNLSFNLENPVYNNSRLYGSEINIKNLSSLENGEVNVLIKSDSLLNDDILEILKAYKINLPLFQKSGKLDSSLHIKIPYQLSKKMHFDGIFKLDNADLKLNDFEFFAKKADVVLKDSLVIISNSELKHKDILSANLDLEINTKDSTASGEAKINSFEIKSKEDSIINIKDLNTKLDIDFKKNTKILLNALKKDLNISLDISKENILVDIKELEQVYPYSNILKKNEIKKGSLLLNIIDKENIDFHINLKEMNLPFEKNNEKITQLNAKGSIKPNITKIKTNDEDIEIIIKENKNTLIKLNNIDLVINQKEDNKTSKKLPNIDLELTNSKIKLDENHIYKTSFANIQVKDSKIDFQGEALDLNLPISKNSKQIKTLQILGNYENDILNIKTKDNKLNLKYDILKEKITMKLDSYDVIYNTNQEEDKDSKTSYYISGKNSNIIINEKYIAKADVYDFIFEDYKTDIDLKYGNTKFVYYKDYAGNINIDAKNMNDDFLNALMNKKLVQGGNVNLWAKGKNGIINGVASLDDNKIVDLAILNNLLILINTSPGIINPFLAIPSLVGMATSGGFNLNGYRVKEGKVEFFYDFNNKFLNMHKIKTKGNGIDFEGFTTINFDNSKLDARLKLIFLKDYSKIVGSIPVINYVLLGDEKRVDTKVTIYGTLEDPKYKTNFIKEGVSAPVNFLKRIISTPGKIIDSIKDKKEE